jgi:uncharacterized protein YhaN
LCGSRSSRTRETLIKSGDSTDSRIHQLESEVAKLREELRTISARMRRVPANRRRQYTGLERMAILQRRAMRGWNQSETSRHFLVSDDTKRQWRAKSTIAALMQTSTPVNRFPDVVHCNAGTDEALLPGARQAEDRREAGPGRLTESSGRNVVDRARE